MKANKWNDEQLLAINTRGTNIIVSAGAGSGKTAVLTERIIKLLEEGKPLDSLLVITFTNAAAAEMKERIRDKILKHSSLNYLSSMIDSANIMTFDAYFLYLVKKYSYLLDLDKDIEIGDSNYLNKVFKDILDEILDRYYKNNEKRIVNFFEAHPKNNDSELVTALLDIYKKITVKLDIKAELEGYIDRVFNDESVNELAEEYIKSVYNKASIQIGTARRLLIAIKDLTDFVDANMPNPKNRDKLICSELEAATVNLINLLENYTLDNFFILTNFEFPTLSRPKVSDNYKEAIDAYREQITKYRSIIFNKLFSGSKTNPGLFTKNKCFTCLDDIKAEIISNKSFSTLAVDILLEADELFNNYKKSNNYYDFSDIARMAVKMLQDNEDIRNEIRGSLSEILVDEYQDTSDIQELFINLISNNNAYMVGDIKQGIYRFRDANPYNFKKKYDDYSDGNLGFKIDLKKNYRSRNEVVDNINLIFNSLMTNEYGDAQYQDSHQLEFGLEVYNSFNNFEYNMEIVRYDTGVGKSNQVEPFYVAKDIQRRIEAGEMVYDKEIKGLRKLQYSDFCILTEAKTEFIQYRKVLEYHNIPVNIIGDRKLSEDEITGIILSLIKLVVYSYKKEYNNEYYHALMSVSRSFIYELEDEYLFNLLIDRSKTQMPDCEIAIKADKLAKYINVLSNSDIYDMMLTEFNIFDRLPRLGNIKDKLVIIEYIKSFIENVSKIGIDLEKICEAFDDLLSTNESIKYKIENSKSPGVKIMTIHKSKGLEFPVCYYLRTNTKFNMADFQGNAGYFESSGMFMENDVPSVIKEVGISRDKIKFLSEKIRLFYVALTRAREKMIIFSPIIPEDKQANQPDEYDCFNDFIYSVDNKLLPYVKMVDVDSLDIVDLSKIPDRRKKVVYKEKPKYDDSNYFGEVVSKSRISKELVEVLSDKEQENIDLGLILHEYMEYMDFTTKDTSFISNENHRRIINNVLKNKLFDNINKANTYPEYEFIMHKDGQLYHGIIDLLAIYDDHIDIIDYKLADISHMEYDRQLGIYKEYVLSIDVLTDIQRDNINCYLLALLTSNIREV